MKNKILLVLVFIIFTLKSNAQYTAIPDNAFEQALIDLGLDDVIDGQVLTSNINTVTELDVWDYFIQDLTGIEDFTALQWLDCSENFLTELDIWQNTQLLYLDCEFNQLSNLDVSNNPNLVGLLLNNNPISQLDISNNLAIIQLWCDFTTIPNLDLSNHTLLEELYCGNNASLTELNLKNGNNGIITELDATNTPNLTCIQVDDEVAANNGDFPYTNWVVDTQVTYSENCSLGIHDNLLQDLTLYPNPAQNILHINNPKGIAIKQVQVYSMLGKKILEVTPINNIVNVFSLQKGLYVVKISTANGVTNFKMVKK